MAYGKTIVNYDRTNHGTVYLRDIGQRVGLGGGKGIYTLGQDRYLAFGADATFVSTSDVMLSATKGVLKGLVDMTAVRVTIVPDA